MFSNQWNQLAAPASLIRVALAALVLLADSATAAPAAAQAAGTAMISSPVAGQVLRGAFPIMGTAGAADFASAEVDFAYSSDASNTWFMIQALDQPVANDTIATWDTTTISDGDYVLRLRVVSLDGTSQDTKVNVEVRNYTAPAAITLTAAPTQASILQIPSPRVLVPSAAPPVLPPSTPTLLPPNPAGPSVADIYGQFWHGALIVLGLFVVVGLLLRRRR